MYVKTGLSFPYPLSAQMYDGIVCVYVWRMHMGVAMREHNSHRGLQWKHHTRGIGTHGSIVANTGQALPGALGHIWESQFLKKEPSSETSLV